MTRKKYDLTPAGTTFEVCTAPVICVEKGWGRVEDGIGEIFAYHEPQENTDQRFNVQTVKLLHIAKDKKLSRHFHICKREYFIVACGSFKVEMWDRKGVLTTFTMRTDNRIIIEPGVQHRMTGLEDNNVLVEVSTLDTEEDSYRIEKGD